MSSLKKGVLKDFDTAEYTATIEIANSGKQYLEGIAVAKNILSGEMVAGRKLAVVFFDEHNVKDGVVVAVY